MRSEKDQIRTDTSFRVTLNKHLFYQLLGSTDSPPPPLGAHCWPELGADSSLE